MRSPVARLFADLAAAFDAARVPWYLFGAQAAILYGVARLTGDVDVTVRVPPPMSHESLAQFIERHGFSRRITDRAFIAQTSVIPFLHHATALPLDVILGGPGLEDQFLDRAIIRDVEGVLVPVARAEDLVVMKVLAGRPKDRDDIIAMIRTQGTGLNADDVRETLGLVACLG